MIKLLCMILVDLSVCAFSPFAETANAGPQVLSSQPIQQSKQVLRPLEQPLFADPSAMLPLCSSLPQATEKVIDSINDLIKGLNCQGNFPLFTIENYGAYINGCCSPQKSFSVQDQQAAGCANSDTVKQCMDKLTGYCINKFPEKDSLKNRLNFDPKRADDISIKMKELSERMIKLRSLIP